MERDQMEIEATIGKARPVARVWISLLNQPKLREREKKAIQWYSESFVLSKVSIDFHLFQKAKRVDRCRTKHAVLVTSLAKDRKKGTRNVSYSPTGTVERRSIRQNPQNFAIEQILQTPQSLVKEWI
jgi:hypothetical protein